MPFCEANVCNLKKAENKHGHLAHAERLIFLQPEKRNTQIYNLHYILARKMQNISRISQ